MIEIKFRGLNDYGWHTGHLLISYKDRAYIVTDMIDGDYANIKRSQEVELSTVGQYTGLKDKNGNEIFKGDIVSNKEFAGEVYYTSRGTWDCASYILGGYNESSEIIGNIYENPELLKEGK